MDWMTSTGHGVIVVMLAWIMRALHRTGIKFDFRVWRNGKPKGDS